MELVFLPTSRLPRSLPEVSASADFSFIPLISLPYSLALSHTSRVCLYLCSYVRAAIETLDSEGPVSVCLSATADCFDKPVTTDAPYLQSHSGYLTNIAFEICTTKLVLCEHFLGYNETGVIKLNKKTNSVALRPQANYTD
jgi:hypothetical protein